MVIKPKFILRFHTLRQSNSLMTSRHIQPLLQRLKSTTHLLQLQSLLLKTALHHQDFVFSKFILASSSISIHFTRLVFDKSPIRPPLFAVNTMIKCYSKSATPLEAVTLFVELQRSGVKPDKFTYPFLFRACGICSLVGVGGAGHSMVLKVGLDWDLHICNTLLRMYAGCGVIDFSRKLFDEMAERDVVSWSSIIAAYLGCGYPLKSLLIFQEMVQAKCEPNFVTLVSLLAACTQLLKFKLGETIHCHIISRGIDMQVELGTALLEMYAKCGHIREAYHIFNSMRDRNLQTWTVMISGLADYGFGNEAISLFTKMEEAGLHPDSKSFSAILSACSHMGLVDKGKYYFHKLVKQCQIVPTMEHYGCLVDMFGRSGKIEEAYQVIRSMPMEPNSVVLRSFISSCKTHGSNFFGDKNLTNLLIRLEPELGANYVLIAGSPSISSKWEDIDKLRVAMKGKGLKKEPGSSWVELQDICC